jgi:hypothetical protein
MQLSTACCSKPSESAPFTQVRQQAGNLNEAYGSTNVN